MGPVPIRGDFSDMKQTATGRTDKVIDEQTILMKDGKIVRLLGLDYPFGNHVYEPDEPYLAKKLLESLLPSGTEVALYQPRNRTPDQKRGLTNRMGHTLAHLVKKNSGQWVNGTLVAEGLARAMTDSSNPEMADQLYKIEQGAREAGKALWAKDSLDGLLTPETAERADGQFRVIEGTVNRASTNKNNLYLNFGSDWKKDFTVMITPSVRKALSKDGIDAISLAGKKVRVRGWVRKWNGPFIELETAQRIEVLSTASSTASSTEPVDNLQSNIPPTTGQINP